MGDNTLGWGKSAIVYETDLRVSEWVDKKWRKNSRKMKQQHKQKAKPEK